MTILMEGNHRMHRISTTSIIKQQQIHNMLTPVDCTSVSVCLYSQEDACSQKQEERVFHQVGVSSGQHRQVGIIFFQFLHPLLPRLEHRFELSEGAARWGRGDAGDRRLDYVSHGTLYSSLRWFLIITNTIYYLVVVYQLKIQFKPKSNYTQYLLSS